VCVCVCVCVRVCCVCVCVCVWEESSDRPCAITVTCSTLRPTTSTCLPQYAHTSATLLQRMTVCDFPVVYIAVCDTGRGRKIVWILTGSSPISTIFQRRLYWMLVKFDWNLREDKLDLCPHDWIFICAIGTLLDLCREKLEFDWIFSWLDWNLILCRSSPLCL